MSRGLLKEDEKVLKDLSQSLQDKLSSSTSVPSDLSASWQVIEHLEDVQVDEGYLDKVHSKQPTLKYDSRMEKYFIQALNCQN